MIDVSGSSGLQIIDSGCSTLTFSGANTTLGTTSLTAGTLRIGSVGSLYSSTGNILLNSGSALSLNNNVTLNINNPANGTLTFAGPTTLQGGLLQANPSVNILSPAELGSGISVAGPTLAKTGTGSLTLAGNLTYTGNTTISEGTLSLDSGTPSSVAVFTGWRYFNCHIHPQRHLSDRPRIFGAGNEWKSLSSMHCLTLALLAMPASFPSRAPFCS